MKEVHVRCPQCGAEARDGATFCDKCDAILDQSFLTPGKDVQAAQVQVTQPPVQAAKAAPKSADDATQEAFNEIALFVKGMSTSRRVALGAAVAVGIFSCFPWAVLPGEGSVPGLDLGSIWVIAAAVVFGAFLIAESLGKLGTGWFGRHYILAQTAIMALVLLFCVYRFIHPGDVVEDTAMLKSSGYDVRTSIQMGLPLTAISAVTGAVGVILSGKK
jgi:hypothetical protein